MQIRFLPLLVLPTFLSLAGCAAGKAIAKTAIDVALAACISEHAEIEDEAELQALCKWGPEVAPHVKNLLAARKRGLAAAKKAGACGPASADGGL